MKKIFTLNVKFDFAASHFLTDYHGKCENLHGHNYILIVSIKNALKKDVMVINFKQIKKIVNKKVIEKLDHKHLNDIFENPSLENVTSWIWEQLKSELPLKKLTLYENERCFCEFEG